MVMVIFHRGAVKLQLPLPKSVDGVTLDPNPDWTFDALLVELNSIEKKLNASSKFPIPFTKTESRYVLVMRFLSENHLKLLCFIWKANVLYFVLICLCSDNSRLQRIILGEALLCKCLMMTWRIWTEILSMKLVIIYLWEENGLPVTKSI